VSVLGGITARQRVDVVKDAQLWLSFVIAN